MLRIQMKGSNNGSGLESVAACIRDGGVVCFPTDTTYGLAVDPFNPGAVEALFALKGRPAAKPILLLVDSLAMLETLAVPPPGFDQFVRRFWPGPITAILPARDGLPSRITASTATVGVRWPNAPIPLALLDAVGRPVTATSANRTGMGVATTIDEAVAQFADAVEGGLSAAIDAGRLPAAGASTIIDMTVDHRVVVREGPVGFNELDAFLAGRVRRATG